MLFSDITCFVCGNPSGKTTLGKGEKLGLTSFSADGGDRGLLEPKSYENYGIYICDPCLTEGGRQGRVRHTVTEHRPPNIYEDTWNPDA